MFHIIDIYWFILRHIFHVLMLVLILELARIRNAQFVCSIL